ncbi:hypothetical protein LSH36_264g00050 [Paralvinella palmiformis]|uniref:Uncharacterized protein n=1 Tax=Paralvinella palmiformis TaxID=53620 RepID=A0AAD9JK82_9ANNE|nr:hypothetical protein LSH36_264g00050 [Paralvinella palmiformis]
MKTHTSPEPTNAKIRCGICTKDLSADQPVTLRCSHTFCFQCIKSNHEAAVQNGQSEADRLYCPRCAEITALPGGSLENVRPFYVCNRIKDLHTLSQMNRELMELNHTDMDKDRERIDSRSYTIEGPTLEDLKEVDDQLLATGCVDDVSAEANEAEPYEEAAFIEVDCEFLATGCVDDISVQPNEAEPYEEAAFISESATVVERDIGNPYSCCSRCQAPEVRSYCFRCGELLCETCRQHHTEANESHWLIHVKKHTMEALICKTHNELIREFCTVCSLGTCNACRTSSHQDHEFGEFCSPKESNQLMTEVGKQREKNVRVLRKLNRLMNKLTTYMTAMNDDVTNFIQATKVSEVFVSPLKKHIQELITKTHQEFSKVELEVTKKNELLNNYVKIHHTRCLIPGINDIAIKYRISGLYDVSRTADHSDDDYLIDSDNNDDELTNAAHQAVTVCKAPSLLEYVPSSKCLEYSCEEVVEKATEIYQEVESSEAFEEMTQPEDLLQNLEQTEQQSKTGDGDSSLSSGDKELEGEEQRLEHIFESTPASDEVRVEISNAENVLIMSNAAMTSENPDQDRIKEPNTPELTTKELRKETTEAEEIHMNGGAELDQTTVKVNVCEQVVDDVATQEKRELNRQYAVGDENSIHTMEKRNTLMLESDSLETDGPLIGDTTQQPDSTNKFSNGCEDQLSWKTHERLWSVRQSARSVGFLPNGSILAAGRDNLHVFDAGGRALGTPFETSILTDAWKLAVHQPSSAVVVVDPTINAFAVFTPNGQYDPLGGSTRWSCATHNIKGIHVPMCATFAGDGDVLLATGSGRTLLKYSQSGDLLWQRELAHDCYYMSTDTTGRIITSGGGSVHVYDSCGNELSEFPERKEQLRDPWGVCTDGEDNVYVCELNRPVVTVFSAAGKYIRELDLNSWPRDIARHGDKLLIASVHSIEMHQLKGK